MAFDALRERLAGVVSIPVTPFDAHGEIDEAAYLRVLDRLVEGGIEVVTINGNVGEYYSLTSDEATRLVDLSTKRLGNDAVALVGVGGTVSEAKKAAQYAAAAGAGAIMIHQPVHNFQSRAGWVAYHSEVASAVPELGVLPYIRSQKIGGAQISQLTSAAKNVIGVKYAIPGTIGFATVIAESNSPGVVWIDGLAELSAPGSWAIGATGFTSALANISPQTSLQFLQSMRESDRPKTMEIWNRIRALEDLRGRDGFEHSISVIKEAMSQLGVCERYVRPPITVLDEPQRAEIAGALKVLGV